MNKTELKRNVARGAKFLDKDTPGWWKKIKVRKLNMGISYNCILGQLDGSYWTRQTSFGNTFDEKEEQFAAWAIKHGFNTLYFDHLILKELWLEEIKKRKEAQCK